jgi:4-hydroxy-4-methyl-2-oxoglutarate aldolase
MDSSTIDIIRANACSGMFSDNLDKMGYRHQVIDGLLMNRAGGRFFGSARTVRIETLDTDDENIKTGLGFLESMEPGQVLCIEGSRVFAYFGELMTRLSLRRGLGGVVVGGLTRDTLFTHTVNELIVCAEGYTPRDIKGRGRVAAVDCPVSIHGVTVNPGDWVFGDGDGIVVVPGPALDGLVARITRNIGDELDIIAAIDRGESIGSILERHREF